MSIIETVKELTKSSFPLIAETATKALALNRDLTQGKLTADEFNELLEDLVSINNINKDMLTVEVYRLVVKAYHNILTLKTITSL